MRQPCRGSADFIDARLKMADREMYLEVKPSRSHDTVKRFTGLNFVLLALKSTQLGPE